MKLPKNEYIAIEYFKIFVEKTNTLKIKKTNKKKTYVSNPPYTVTQNELFYKTISLKKQSQMPFFQQLNGKSATSRT